MGTRAAATKDQRTGDRQEWVTLVAAAKELGEQRLTVLTRALKGELEAKYEAGRSLISRASLDRVLAAKRQAKEGQ